MHPLFVLIVPIKIERVVPGDQAVVLFQLLSGVEFCVPVPEAHGGALLVGSENAAAVGVQIKPGNGGPGIAGIAENDGAGRLFHGGNDDNTELGAGGLFHDITAEFVVIGAVVAVDDAVGAVPVERIALSLRRGDLVVAGRALQGSPGKVAASFYGKRSGSILLVAEDGGPQPVGGIVSGVLHRDDVVVVIIPGILNLRHHGLLLVIDALGGLGLLPCVVQGRQHQARQNGDDRDNDKDYLLNIHLTRYK